jgi:hypothetical protein
MALVKCRECLKKISTTATVCPHCGAPGYVNPSSPPPLAPKPTPRWQVVTIAIGAVTAMTLLYVMPRWEAHARREAAAQSAAAAEQRNQQLRQQRVEQFSRLRDALRAEAEKDLAARRHHEVIGDLQRWDLEMDADTRKLYQVALDATAAERKAKEEKELAARLEAERVQQEAQAKITAAAQAQDRRIGKEPVASAWDGHYYEVERYLEKHLNDPDSLDWEGCTKAAPTQKGWVTRCEYRAKNGFGALIKQNTIFLIKHGQVIEAGNL